MDKVNLAYNIEVEHPDVFQYNVATQKRSCVSCVNTVTCRLLCVGVLVVIISCFVWIIVCTAGGCDRTKCTMDCTEPHPWGYTKHTGPECWGTCYSVCSTGRKQSPIDLDHSVSVDHNFTSPLKLQGYSTPHTASLYNTGHSVQLDLLVDTYVISGVDLRGSYIASNVHFHWGSDKHKGSEHTFNGDHYSMEMHIVHYSANYSGVPDATEWPYGLAVLAFVFQISDDDNPAYDVIVDNLHNIAHPGEAVSVTNVSLVDLLPDSVDTVYRYDGSVTTPGCAENVVWTVFTSAINLSERQIKAFQSSIYTDEEESQHLDKNYRPVQPLNERILTHGKTSVELQT